MMPLSATLSRGNSSREYAAWIPTTTLGEEQILQQRSLQFFELITGSTCTYRTIANMSANPTITRPFVLLQHLTDYEDYLLDQKDTSGLQASSISHLDPACLGAVTQVHINSRYSLAEQFRAMPGCLEIQIRYSVNDLSESSWISTRVIQGEEEPEIIHADTNQGLSFRDLVNALDKISHPTEKEDVPLPFDPDDYPVV
jgi:hypothetical protein